MTDVAPTNPAEAAKTKASAKPDAAAVDARLVARITTEYMLRVLRLITEAHDGELLTAIIAQAIIAANTGHLRRPEGLPLSEPWLPADELRRPISIHALAGSLGLPFETTRRHVKKLADRGRCVRVTGGVIVPAEMLARADNTERAELNLTYVRRMLRALRDAGLTAD
jgi:hypothetical protein